MNGNVPNSSKNFIISWCFLDWDRNKPSGLFIHFWFEVIWRMSKLCKWSFYKRAFKNLWLCGQRSWAVTFQILFNKWLQTFSVRAEWLTSVSTSRNMPLTLKSVPRWFLSQLIICENKEAAALMKTSQYSETSFAFLENCMQSYWAFFCFQILLALNSLLIP